VPAEPMEGFKFNLFLWPVLTAEFEAIFTVLQFFPGYHTNDGGTHCQVMM
jgi:hypothetical protein